MNEAVRRAVEQARDVALTEIQELEDRLPWALNELFTAQGRVNAIESELAIKQQELAEYAEVLGEDDDQ